MGIVSRAINDRDTAINVRSGPQAREYQGIVKLIAEDHPHRVLDWGCGWGQITEMLKTSGLEVTAFDYREDLEADGVYSLDRFPEIQAHLSSEPVNLPFEDESFDAVLSCGVLEHVFDPDASLNELLRVLQPGGKLYVFKLPNKYSYLEAIARPFGLYYHGKLPYDKIYNRRSATMLVERHGYQVEEFWRSNMLPLTLQGRIATRLMKVIWRINSLLGRIPLLNLLATNLNLVATVQPDAVHKGSSGSSPPTNSS